MAILQGDIKLVESQVMQDVDEGGGAPTANIIVDALQNNIFPDIDEVARAGGRVYLRKVHVSVQTDNRDTYQGSNVIVAEPPEDPNVSVTIFSTGDTFDRREDATNRIESYLNGASEWPAFLLDNHITGQMVVQLFHRTNVAPPTIGRVLKLVKNEGLSNEEYQYVRVTNVTPEERTFSYSSGATFEDYKATVSTCDISDALRFDFPGTAANRLFARDPSKTLVRDTIVADAARFYGASKLAVDAGVGDLGVTAETVYTPLVPNARTEVPLIDQMPAREWLLTLDSSPRLVEVGGASLAQRIRIGQENRGFNYVTILKPLPAPGSVRVHFRALGNSYVLTDDGEGHLTGPGSGTINYATGSVVATLSELPDDRSAVVFYWGQNVAYTDRQGQLATFRPPRYAFDLDHDNIQPGTLQITWTSESVAKTATDNGTGKLTGDASGSIVYQTGILEIVPTNLIDPGGEFAIEYDYKEMEEESFTSLAPDSSGSVAVTLAALPTPGTLRAEWLTTRETSQSSGSTSASGSTNKSSMSNSTSGNTTTTSTAMVDTTKSFRYFSPEVAAAYAAPKDQATVVVSSVTYPSAYDYFAATGLNHPSFNSPEINALEYEVTTKTPVTTTTSSSTSGTGSSTTSQGATYSTSCSQTSKSAITVSHQITDNGSGSWFGTFGTINYATGEFTLKVRSDYVESNYTSNYEQANEFESLNATGEATTTVGGGASTSTTSGGGGSATQRGGDFGNHTFKETFGENTLVVRYQTGSPSAIPHTMSYQPPGVTLDLCPYTTDTVVPGSVQFTWMSHTYTDFEGKVYIDRTAEDPGILCGSLDYVAGTAKMAYYVVNGPATSLTLQSLWTRKPREHVANIVFNTALAPLQPSGLTISVLDVSGAQLLGTSDLSGNITGTHIHGKVDYETGLAEIQFGDYVLDSGLTAAQKLEPWYNADDVRTSDSKIWRPWPIDPETLRYAAVAYFYLPLDATILGLDPVRLPQDGRVPMFRPGGFAVVGNKKTIEATVSNGQTVNCARVRLSRVRVIGNDGVVINTGYTANLEAGTVTFSDVSGYSQPVTVEHRVEDMVMVATVQIGGQMTFTRELTHAYDADDSYISGALVGGDLRSRVSTTFDQVSWTNVWSDSQIGSSAAGTFNDNAFPIVVTNKGAVTERWYAQFNSDTVSFKVFGEHVGFVGTGNTSADFAPNNPATGEPYFTIPAGGWGGGGWASGNVFRFNTVGATLPVWVIRTVQQGPETEDLDKFTLLVRGDVDAP